MREQQQQRSTAMQSYQTFQLFAKFPENNDMIIYISHIQSYSYTQLNKYIITNLLPFPINIPSFSFHPSLFLQKTTPIPYLCHEDTHNMMFSYGLIIYNLYQINIIQLEASQMQIITYPFGSNTKWGTIKQKNSLPRKINPQSNFSSLPEHSPNLIKHMESLPEGNTKYGESFEGEGVFIPNSRVLDLRRKKIRDNRNMLQERYRKKRICSYNNLQYKNTSNEHLQNSSVSRKGLRRRKSQTNIRRYDNKVEGNIQRINGLNDEQMLMELEKKYNYGPISPIKQSENKVLDFQSLLQVMQQTHQSKQTEIQVLSIYKDELQLISYFRQAFSHPNPEDPLTHSQPNKKISLSSLKSKSKIYQSVQKKTQQAQKIIEELSEQSNIYNKYLMYISEQIEKCRNLNEDDCLLDLKEEKQIMENNLKNEIEFIKRELDYTKNGNLKEVRKLEEMIRGLRVEIREKEEKLKQLNNRIFHAYTRRNTRSLSKNKMSKILIQSNQQICENLQQIRDQDFFNKLKRDQENRKKLQTLALHKKKINYDQLLLKQLIFTQQNNTIYLQHLYQVSKKQMLSHPLKLNDAQSILPNTKTVISLTNSKLKSLIFYFDQSTSEFKGLEAKYSQFTHSYDIGRESEIVRVGVCEQKDFKYQLPCKDKQFIQFNLLKSDKVYGFAVYFNKPKQQNTISKFPTRKNSIASQNSENSDSCGRISIQSKSKLQSNSSSDKGAKIILSRKNRPTNRIGALRKNQPEKLGEAYTEYCLHK